MKKLSTAIVLLALAAGVTSCSAERMSVADSCDEVKALALSIQTSALALGATNPDEAAARKYASEVAGKFDDLSKRVAEPMEGALQSVVNQFENPTAEFDTTEVEKLDEICPNLVG